MSSATASRAVRPARTSPATRKSCPLSRSTPMPSAGNDALRERAERLLAREIAFVHNAEFTRPRADQDILAEPEPRTSRRSTTRTAPPGLPAYFATLYAVPLLGPEEERRLFRRLNFLKFRANSLRSRIDPHAPDEALLVETERCLAEADAIRTRIVQANLRLVVALSRKYSDSPDLFDELLADGNLMLLHAVDKFDYGRGFRFSTYATHAVRRSFFRWQRRRWTEAGKVRGLGDSVYELADPDVDGDDDLDGTDRALAEGLRGAIETSLDERERRIVGARFGLGEPGGTPCTLQQLASRLDLCKERVRQLQLRALGKLKEALAPQVLERAESVRQRAVCEDLGPVAESATPSDPRKDAAR